MSNGTAIISPSYFTWLYAGIDFSLAGNGGPDCANYLSSFHRLTETILILLASVAEIFWALKRITYAKGSDFSFVWTQPLTLNSCNKTLPSQILSNSPGRPIAKTILLILVTLIFGIEIGFKFSTNSLIYLLNPCHILTVSLIYLLSVDERKQSKLVTFIFRVQLHLLGAPLLAILFPVVNTRFLSFETHSYWIHHILIYIGPGYLLTVGGPFTAEPITDRWWPILTVGIAFFYHFSILQGLGMVTQANLNCMLCPAVSDPFKGPYYRVWAFGHQHVLNLLHGKLYQAAIFFVALTVRYLRMLLPHRQARKCDENGNEELEPYTKKLN